MEERTRIQSVLTYLPTYLPTTYLMSFRLSRVSNKSTRSSIPVQTRIPGLQSEKFHHVLFTTLAEPSQAAKKPLRDPECIDRPLLPHGGWLYATFFQHVSTSILMHGRDLVSRKTWRMVKICWYSNPLVDQAGGCRQLWYTYIVEHVWC